MGKGLPQRPGRAETWSRRRHPRPCLSGPGAGGAQGAGPAPRETVCSRPDVLRTRFLLGRAAAREGWAARSVRLAPPLGGPPASCPSLATPQAAARAKTKAGEQQQLLRPRGSVGCRGREAGWGRARGVPVLCLGSSWFLLPVTAQGPPEARAVPGMPGPQEAEMWLQSGLGPPGLGAVRPGAARPPPADAAERRACVEQMSPHSRPPGAYGPGGCSQGCAPPSTKSLRWGETPTVPNAQDGSPGPLPCTPHPSDPGPACHWSPQQWLPAPGRTQHHTGAYHLDPRPNCLLPPGRAPAGAGLRP